MQEKNQAYVLHCCSLEALVNESRRYAERLDGVKAEEFIEEKLAEISKKKFYKHESLHNFDMYMPNWRLFDAAIWFRSRTVAAAHKDSVGYLFWEGFDGYHFQSIDELIKQDPYPRQQVRSTPLHKQTHHLLVISLGFLSLHHQSIQCI